MLTQSFALSSREISTIAKGVSIEVVDHINEVNEAIKNTVEYQEFPYNFPRKDDYDFDKLQTLVALEDDLNNQINAAQDSFIEQYNLIKDDILDTIRNHNSNCLYGKEFSVDFSRKTNNAKNVYQTYVDRIRKEVFDLKSPDLNQVYSLAKAMIIAKYKSRIFNSLEELLSEVYDELIEKYHKND